LPDGSLDVDGGGCGDGGQLALPGAEKEGMTPPRRGRSALKERRSSTSRRRKRVQTLKRRRMRK
jgi:hypothetical protein